MIYDELLEESVERGLVVIEFEPRSRASGLISGNLIGIQKSLTYTEKGCILAEEIGHHQTGIGNILNQSKLNSRRQEVRARQWGHRRIIPFSRFLDAHKEKISGRHDLAAYLGITEQFLQEAVDRYRDKHGLLVKIDDFHILCLDPLGILEVFKTG